MLRVRVDNQPMTATFHVEGKLVGNLVDELRKVWTEIHTDDPQKQTVIELTSVLVVDAAGRRLLRQLHATGALLAGNGMMIKTLIKEITENTSGESAFVLTRDR